MLRLSELRLPLDHTDEQLNEAVLSRLKIAPDQVLKQRLVKRAASMPDDGTGSS